MQLKDGHDPSFSVEEQIRRQVEIEDLAMWSERADSPLPPPQKREPLKLTPTSAYVLGSQMVKKSISIMMP